MNCYALSYFSVIQLQNEQKRRASHALPWSARLMPLTNRAWSTFSPPGPDQQPQETARSLPPDMRQLIVDLCVELPTMSLREIAEICEARLKLRPSHNSVKMALASGPPPSIQMRRFPHFDDPPDSAQRRHNMVQLHAEGWSITSIAEYLARLSADGVYHLEALGERGCQGPL